LGSEFLATPNPPVLELCKILTTFKSAWCVHWCLVAAWQGLGIYIAICNINDMVHFNWTFQIVRLDHCSQLRLKMKTLKHWLIQSWRRTMFQVKCFGWLRQLQLVCVIQLQKGHEWVRLSCVCVGNIFLIHYLIGQAWLIVLLFVFSILGGESLGLVRWVIGSI